MALIAFSLGVIVGVLALAFVRRPAHAKADRPGQGASPAMAESFGQEEIASAPAIEDPVKSDAAPPSARERLLQIRREIDVMEEQIKHPDDLLAIGAFCEGSALLRTDAFSASEVLEYLGSAGYVLPCMAALALPHRPDVSAASALAATLPFGGYPLRFLLDYLESLPNAEHLPQLIRQARDWWWEATGVRQRLRNYFRWAEAHGPGTTAVPLSDLDEAVLEEIRSTLARFEEPVLRKYIAQLADEQSARRERRILGEIGHFWSPSPDRATVVHDRLTHHVDRLRELIAGPLPRPVLLCGEPGVGKTTLVDALLGSLREDGWLLFEASATDVLAGQKYIGELEGRARQMLGALKRQRALWRIPDFFELLHKGSHSQDPRGLLDLVLPAIERRELLVVGEITPRQLAQLLLARPAVRRHIEVVLLPALEQPGLEELCAAWARSRAESRGQEVAGASALAEARRMAAQYFPEQHEPGRTLRLLEDALREALQAQPCRLPLDQDGLLRAVSFRSGLPLEVIDDRQSLDLGAIRAFFHKRVIGQEEAVECLVDRIAMLKAGLSDGNRPIGVFLFAGPTGTGKTELAKTLGQLLFGSDERLLRLDMSEYQSGDALARMLDDDRQGGSRSLVSRIREQPFSVVLLDEFEKAHPSVWDLFLQVFDDGRLSDRSGNVADFRHAIIILTSNAGSTLSRTAGPGFTSTAGGYSRSVVEKALFETFRKEFLNRIDRVVLFKPLDRSLMREILYKELDLVLTRRGLRNRDWAIEWEPSAVEFLLDRGFTPDLGARPLRRAIDQYLLAPLARRIVGRDAPEGDQFLFVRASGDRLEVEFVDPDAPLPIPAIPDEATGDYSLPGLVYSPVASPLAVDYLHAQRRRLAEAISSEPWSLGRAEDFAAMAQTGFWERPERFAVLDRIERRDRIESALQTADRLGNRLGRSGNGDAKFLARFAQLLWLLELAMRSLQDRRPQDALLHLSVADGDLRRDLPGAWQWLQQILAMYLAWAEKRNMRVEVLEQSKEKGTAWLAVSGFAALELLDAEAGLHVLEADEEESMPRRISVRIRIAPDLPGQRRSVPPASIGDNNVRRRYRSGPSPLVRNTAPSWRTGRLDRVLAGDFDIVPTT